jgi:hypothetical protein
MLPAPEFSFASRQMFVAIVQAFVVTSFAVAFSGSEESGGSVTGPLQHLLDMGADLLFAALILVAWMPRSAAALSCLGAVLCLPNYSYGYAPGVYRWLFPGGYLHASRSVLVLAPFDMIATVALFYMIWVASRTLRPENASLADSGR